VGDGSWAFLGLYPRDHSMIHYTGEEILTLSHDRSGVDDGPTMVLVFLLL
jgi:hypothetical protein